MADPYIGQIILVGFNFAPVGYALCHGQLLPIVDNEALFNLIGTTYGGDGESTFAVPDLRGRLAVGTGTGTALQTYTLGDLGGDETVFLTTAQLPAHTHALDTAQLAASLKCTNGAGNSRSPVGNVPAREAAGVTMTYSQSAPDGTMHAAAVTSGAGATATAGGSQPHDNMQPFLSLNYIIALYGTFPSP